MPVYLGEMEQEGHDAKLPASIYLDKGTITLKSGPTQLGEWKLYQVVIEERDDDSILFRADDDELILHLKEHESFLAETAGFRRGSARKRREPTHEAFRKPVEGPTLSEEIKDDVSREVSGVVEEIRGLWSMVPIGPPLWIGLAVFLLLVIFLPGLIVGVLLAVGVAALVVGALGYVEDSMAVRLPGSLTPVRLIAIGVVSVAVGIVVALIR